MGRYIVNRLAQGAIVLFLASVLIFLLARVIGDPVYALVSADATLEEYEQVRRQLGLDRPLIVQYGDWLAHVAQGDLGNSYRTKRQVGPLIAERLVNTIKLAVPAFLIAVLVGLPLGIIAAVRRASWIDQLARVLAALGMSVPSFWFGILLVLMFAVELRWLPTSGIGDFWHYVMPTVTLAFSTTLAGLVRIERSSMLDQLGSDYLTAARAKGLSERRLIVGHALPNALIPAVTYAGFSFSLFISGSVVVETIFRWPGLGLLSYNAVLTRDYPVLQGIILVVTAWVLVVNLVVDVLYAYIDPRIRY